MQNPIPYYTRSLTALSKILDKAEAHAEAKKLKPDVLPQQRLIADMLPLRAQVMIACDHAKGAAARLSGTENPVFADDETTLPELRARIAKTIAFMATIPANAFDTVDGNTITIKSGGTDRSFPAPQYYFGYSIPNFYFHMATAHCILRANGVDVGKSDFMGV